MKCLHIAKYGRLPVLTDCELPRVRADEALVQLRYAPINPSDINFYQGRYGVKKSGFPIVGFEGSGQIIKANQKSLIGCKVSVLASDENGTHATHIAVNLSNLILWHDDAELSQVCTAWINPFSCLGLCSFIRQESPDTILISAASSQLSGMLIKYIHSSYPERKLMGLARTNNKAESLKCHGLHQLLVIDENLVSRLREQLKGKTLFFDCIGGSLSGQIFNSLPKSSTMICYGRLSGQSETAINLGQLYFKNKSIQGFWLNQWLTKKTDAQISRLKDEITHNFSSYFKQSIRKIIPLQNWQDAYRFSIKDQNEGKILLCMSN